MSDDLELLIPMVTSERPDKAFVADLRQQVLAEAHVGLAAMYDHDIIDLGDHVDTEDQLDDQLSVGLSGSHGDGIFVDPLGDESGSVRRGWGRIAAIAAVLLALLGGGWLLQDLSLIHI